MLATPPRSRARSRARRVTPYMLGLAALAGGLTAMGPGAGTAAAAACPAGLTVRGIAVTGTDCENTPTGGVQITDPKFTDSGAVAVKGKMVLDAARATMVQEQNVVPLPVTVNGTPVAIGKLTVGGFTVCDIKQPQQNPGSNVTGTIPAQAAPDTAFVPQNIGCRTETAFSVADPKGQVQTVVQALGGLKISDNVLTNPFILAMDDNKGGRVYGTFSVVADKGFFSEAVPAIRFGVGVEVTKDTGVGLTSAGIQYGDSVRLLPGVIIGNPALAIDLTLNRYSGFIQLMLAQKIAAEAGLTIQGGQLQQLNAAASNFGGIPIGAPPFATIKGIRAAWERPGGGGTPTRKATLPGGTTSTSPGKVSGGLLFDAGPKIPGTNLAAFSGDMTLTVSGPQFELAGTLFGFQEKLTLGTARVLMAFQPFRFEAEATANALNIAIGHVFVGITSGHFTGLGEVQLKIPNKVPVVGGTTVAGASVVLSDKALAGGITVDPPIVKPFFAGAAVEWPPSAKISIVTSLAPFITVTPSGSLSLNEHARGPAKGAHAVRGLRLPGGLGQVVLVVEGARKAPGNVRLIGPDGPVPITSAGPALGKARYFLLNKPKAGQYRVQTSGGLVRVQIARNKDIPYIDPLAGFGTRDRPPVTAGTPVQVCWNVKNAPRGAQVDLFEDKNGSLGTGRDIAIGLKPKACFSVPTAGMEPGKHWVYGVLRQGNVPLSARYWPIGITITDPAALAAPTGLQATATADGATVSFNAVPKAAGYAVRAEAIDESVPPVITTIPADPDTTRQTVETSLRGAKTWKISVQGIGDAQENGNLSSEVEVSPTQPVVLAGYPTGLAQVGKPWAFQLDAEGLTSLRLTQGPTGSKITPQGLVTWRPSVKAGKAAPVTFTVEGCRGDRCYEREFTVSAYQAGLYPTGPARGFRVLGNVVRSGQKVNLRAQGVNAPITVKIDGKRVTARTLDSATVEVRLPRLAKGAHDVSLTIGGGLEEHQRGALIVL